MSLDGPRAEMWAAGIADAVLRGDMGEARRYAGILAAERDGELTTPELLAAVQARHTVQL